MVSLPGPKRPNLPAVSHSWPGFTTKAPLRSTKRNCANTFSFSRMKNMLLATPARLPCAGSNFLRTDPRPAMEDCGLPAPAEGEETARGSQSAAGRSAPELYSLLRVPGLFDPHLFLWTAIARGGAFASQGYGWQPQDAPCLPGERRQRPFRTSARSSFGDGAKTWANSSQSCLAIPLPAWRWEPLGRGNGTHV